MKEFFRIALALALLAVAARAGAAPLHVLVSIPPQKYLAERIGGDRIAVTTMLQPGHSPETFEPSPRMVGGLGDVAVYFRIGVPFERAWIDPLIGDHPGMVVVDCCASLASLSPQDAEAATDPHVWTSPLQVLQLAELMGGALTQIDPDGASYYAGNLAALRADLGQLHADIKSMLRDRRTPYFIISHGSLGPFADTYGLVQIPLEAGGHSIGPRQLADIVRRARAEGIRTILVQKQFNVAAARTLARELDAHLVEVDPLAENYLSGMRAIAAAVAGATR